MNIGNAYSDLQEYDRGLGHYELAEKLFPDYGEISYNRGIVYEKQGLVDRAKAEFIKAYKQ